MAENDVTANDSFFNVKPTGNLNRGRTKGAPVNKTRFASVKDRQKRWEHEPASKGKMYSQEEVDELIQKAVDAAVRAALSANQENRKEAKKEDIKVGVK